MTNLKTGKVCFTRPNRSKPRLFTVCDVARIAQQVVDDQNEPPEVVLAYVARQLGFSHISLTRQGTVEAGVSLKKSISIVKIAVAQVAKIAQKFNVRSIVAIIGTIIEVLDKVERIIDRIFENPAQEETDNFIAEGKCKNLKPSVLTER